ncbi:MAG: VanZ family protein [Burkholderiales bacterium]|nr:VanZ family protein [Bacteroidia bacterium]
MLTLLSNYKFIIAIALTIVLSTLPNFHPETYLGLAYTWQLDMLIHGSYYLLLTLLLRYFVFKQTNIFLFAGILFLCSLVLEVLQAYIPKRSLTVLDMLSNFMGIVLGVVLFRIFEIQTMKKQPR